MKPFYKMQLVILLAVFTLYSCSTDSFDDNLDDPEISLVDSAGVDDVNDQLEYKIIPSDFDWTNIPASYANSIWKIGYDFDLGGASITLPDNVTLKFIDGTLNNFGSISGAATKTDAGLVGSFDGSGVLVGTWNLTDVYPEWFGAVGDGVYFDADSFISAVSFLNLMDGGDLVLTTGKNYVIDKEILLYSNIHIIGNSANITVASTNYDVSPNRFFAIFTTVHIDRRPESAPYASFGTDVIRFSNIHVENITFNINRDGNSLALNVMRSSDFSAVRFVDTENSTVENCNFIDKQTSDTWTLVSVLTFENSNNCIARNNNFDRCTAIAVSEGVANIVDGNIMNNSPGTAIEIYLGKHHQIINNELNEQWFDASSLGCSANYALVKNNIIKSSNSSAITMGHPDVDGYPSFGSDYSVVENNYIRGGPVTTDDGTGAILTGGTGIMLQNGVGARIINNTIEGLFKDTAYANNAAAILIGGDPTDQTQFDDLIIEGNRIIGATVGIQVKDHINVTISDNHIENVFRGIYGEATIASSPTGKMILDNNTIKDSGEAIHLNCPENIFTNNIIDTADVFGYLDYGKYTFNNNIIIEALVPPRSLHPVSFTMRDNYFYNTVPLGDTPTGSVVTLRAPLMPIENLIIEGNTIDYPTAGTPTTWVLRAYELQGYEGSQYFN